MDGPAKGFSEKLPQKENILMMLGTFLSVLLECVVDFTH
jgi:hypothetical protein